MPASTDPFPRRIEIRRGRRRTVEIALEQGRFVARVPWHASRGDLDPVLSELRTKLWEKLRRESVYDDAGLADRAAAVAREHLADLALPPFRVRFSRRQRKRWGSCTFDGREGRLRISAALVGHPTWLIDSVLVHELIHLRVRDHGPRFQALLARDPNRERAAGYLEALENLERVGPSVLADLTGRIEGERQSGRLSPPAPPRLFEEP